MCTYVSGRRETSPTTTSTLPAGTALYPLAVETDTRAGGVTAVRTVAVSLWDVMLLVLAFRCRIPLLKALGLYSSLRRLSWHKENSVALAAAIGHHVVRPGVYHRGV